MKPPPFRYARPQTLAEAVEILAQEGEEAKVLSGGQSLVPMMNFRLARPSVLIDVTRLPELQGIERENGVLSIGAAVRQREAEVSATVSDACPVIVKALGHVGHLQTRSRGTVGGSIAHADPAAELPAVALALDAELVVHSVRGERTMPTADLFLGPYWTTLAADEILTRILVPARAGARGACLEVARRAGDFALAGVVAGAVGPPASETLTDVRLVTFGVGGKPTRLNEAERLLADQLPNSGLFREAGAAAGREAEPIAQGAEERRLRRALVADLVERCLSEVAW
jgi:carbon-monoxide dehydrogenase medium subunit